MASGQPASSTAQQAYASPQPAPISDHHPLPAASQAASPPSKQNLKSWWRGFSKGQGSKAPEPTVAEPTGIFGVPLRQSITYANVAISLVDAEGKSYIYGYVPIVVAKCGVYLKEKATNVEGIFRLSGAEKRIKELVVIFNSPDRYGKGLDWDGYTVHDAANVLRRYLNQLPEPIVPLDLYDRFREPLRGHEKANQGSTEVDLDATIVKYQQLITELPPLNRQLLLYILDLLAVFASKSDENRMDSLNLSAIFQPGILSHPQHDMVPAEYGLNQAVLVFLIENQDHFLIGMRGTAADEKTVHDVQNGNTPPPATPSSVKGVVRSASNASAGADSLRRQGGVRRNVSVNSRHSRQSNGAPSPASPAYGTSLTNTPTGGVHRSNTVPSKKSPGLPSNRIPKSPDLRSPTNTIFQPGTPTPGTTQGSLQPHQVSTSSSPHLQPTAISTSNLAPESHVATAGQSHDRLLTDPAENRPDPVTPTKERALFQRSSTTESEKRQPNKLKKKRIPGSANISAQSSQNSLHGHEPTAGLHPSGTPAIVETTLQHPASHLHSAAPPSDSNTTASGVLQGDNVQHSTDVSSPAESDPRPEEWQRASDATLKPQGSVHSLHSRGGEESMNDASDLDHDPAVAAEQKEKRRKWRLSRKRDDSLGANLASPKKTIGSNGGAEISTTSFGSGRPRQSFTGDTVPVGSESGMSNPGQEISNDSGPSNGSKDDKEKKGALGWIKSKMREAKEEKRERDAEKAQERGKGFPPTSEPATSTRGKSMDLKRADYNDESAHYPPPS